MPDIVTRGTASVELTYQQGDEQIAETQLAVTGALSLDEAHNREHLVITSGTNTLSLDTASDLNTALDSTHTGAEKIGWIVKISNNSGNTATIDLTTGTDTLNGVAGGSYSLTDNGSVIIGFDNKSGTKGYNILAEFDPDTAKVNENKTISGTWTFSTAPNLAADTVDAITEIAAAIKSGTDAKLVTGTAGTAENIVKWDANGDAVDSGVAVGGLGTGDALTANGLDQFAATTSLEFKNTVTGETGSGAIVFGTSPTLVTPALGTPSALVGTNITGTAAGLTAGAATTAGTVTTAAQPSITSVGTLTGLAISGTTTIAELTFGITDHGTATSLAINWDSGNFMREIQVGAGNFTFGATSNASAGQVIEIRMTGDGSDRTLTFPATWDFVGIKPTGIAAGKVAMLSLRSFGTTDADVVAIYSEQT